MHGGVIINHHLAKQNTNAYVIRGSGVAAKVKLKNSHIQIHSKI